jgi:peptidoglycan-associated lipoprotein
MVRRWSSTRVTIEGHCDVRGTSEYNLALGERRASAVRSYLINLGIEPERLLVVSKGEDSPVGTGDNESCWRENRRGHFVITAK